MLNIGTLSEAKNLLSSEIAVFEPSFAEFSSIRGRVFCFVSFFKKIFLLPFAIIYKAIKTAFRATSIIIGFSLVLFSLGLSEEARRFFIRRISLFAFDIGDWLLFPLAIIVFFFRHIFAIVIHPRIHLKT